MLTHILNKNKRKMKQKITLTFINLLLFAGLISAQVTKDSIAVLNNEKERLKIAVSINENKLKLAGLENETASRTSYMGKQNDESQRLADKNRDVANDLTTDPQDKTKAKKAGKSAKAAEHAAKDARKASDKLDGLTKDIDELKKKIRDDEQKLSILGGAVLNN